MRVVVLGAGFGGLELTTRLSDEFGTDIDVVLIDRTDPFVFGFSKLEVMFGRAVPSGVRHRYRDLVKPGVRFVQANIESIDPVAKRVETEHGAFEADILVVALGAERDRAADARPPPQPRSAATVRDRAGHAVAVGDGSEMPYELFLGVPKHCAPPVVASAGMTADGWVPVDSLTLETSFPDVYAVGDVTSVGTPKAGVFAEGQAAVVAERVAARVRGDAPSSQYDGHGICYLEFGHGSVAKVDVTFLSGQAPHGSLEGPSTALAADKGDFGTTRVRRWFGQEWEQ